MRRFAKTDEGQAIVLTTIGLAVLMLMVGLGVDVSFLRYQKQQMQKAADAGAVAAASVLAYDKTQADIIAAGQNDAAANGFNNGTNGITVAVNNPPLSGPFQGNDSYVEVIVSQPQPTFFMKVGGFYSVNVSARAVSSGAGSGGGCIYSLDNHTGDTGLLVDGNVSINSTCGIMVNAPGGSALTKKGNSGQINVTNGGAIGVVGDCSLSPPGGGANGCSSSTITPTPVNIAPFSDPLQGVPPPANPHPGACDYTNWTAGKNGDTLYPGVYCGGITIHGNNTVTVTGGLYYIIGGGIDMSGNVSLVDASGSKGDLFYFTSGTVNGTTYTYGGIDDHGTANMNLNAQTSGPQAGILFFEDRSEPAGTYSDIFGGGASGQLNGALYFSKDYLTYKGNPSGDAYQLIVAWQLEFKGNATLTENYSSLPHGGSPIPSAVLAE
ncbi:MAG TPA: pilus assembly protein TadG-related protein [Terriglobales bacterium]|nr:pilus assembly protein TadG-related protein [Terriglobales bacterium]